MRKDNNSMKVKIGDSEEENVLEVGTFYYDSTRKKGYKAYKLIDNSFGLSYAVKEQKASGRYGQGWFHRYIRDGIFIPTFNPRLIGV